MDLKQALANYIFDNYEDIKTHEQAEEVAEMVYNYTVGYAIPDIMSDNGYKN